MKKFINYIAWAWLFWFWIMILSIISRIMFFTFMPVSYWIEYSSIKMLDLQHWEKVQIIHTIRNSRIETVWHYITNTFCNWKTNSKWNTVSPWIILNKTNWPKTIIIELNLPYKLPIWHCNTEISVDIEVWHWYHRDLFFSTEFYVYKEPKPN